VLFLLTTFRVDGDRKVAANGKRRKIRWGETAELVTFTDTKCRDGNTNVVGNFGSSPGMFCAIST